MSDQMTDAEIAREAAKEERDNLVDQRIRVARREGYLEGAATARERIGEAEREGFERGVAAEMSKTDRSALYEAHANALKAVEDLEQTEQNPSGKYKYATIDQFLTMVRTKVLAPNGLSVKMSTKSTKVVLRAGKTEGSKKQVLEGVYQFILRHSSGVADDPVMIFQSVDFFGAQSYGSARAYAAKQYHRFEFCIATGDDDDPDGHEAVEGEGGAKPPADNKPEKVSKETVDGAVAELNKAGDLETLQSTYKAFPPEVKGNKKVHDTNLALAKKFKDAAKKDGGGEKPAEDGGSKNDDDFETEI